MTKSRNIVLTLEKAREWYNSGSTDLREVALQAYTEEELTTPKFTDIKTFEDACRALGVSTTSYIEAPYTAGKEIVDHLHAIYKLDIILKALNGDWKPSMVEDSVYYPHIRLYPAGQKAREAVSKNKGWKLGESLIADGKKYTLVGCYYCSYDGLANFGYEYGVVLPYLGLLGCKSREIAKHMSCYFSKEIFEATYAHHIDTYEWV